VTDRPGLQCGLLADGLAGSWAARAEDNDRSDRFLARALSRGEPLERILRDARSGVMKPPPRDISANVLGALALGVDAGVGLGMRPS